MPEFETTMDSTTFTTTIGLEIHAQLNTKRKMFCGCNNDAQGKESNSVVCPRCLGMPGTLPVANREAILKTIQFGLALDCNINPVSKFDRKHYFYPDLPKGYQISQYDQPFCRRGSIEILNSKSEILNKSQIQNSKDQKERRVIRLNRIHLEEDAGKLNHPAGKDYSLVDLNRASTPLMEIVSEPDIHSPEEAKEFMKIIQAELINQGVSDADMEKGHLRCDANISITHTEIIHRKGTKKRMSGIVEIKNINSFRFVEKALRHEENRLREKYPDWVKGKVTRGFDSTTGETYEQRHKEEAADYRYFPEPDLPPFETEALKNEAEKLVKPSIQTKVAKLSEIASLSSDEALKAVTDKKLSGLIWTNIEQKWVGSLAKLLVHSPELIEKDQKLLIEYSKAIFLGKVSANLAKKKILNSEQFQESESQVDEGQVSEAVKKIISENPDALKKYQAGKENLLGFFVGQVMKEFKGQVEPQIINRIIREELKNVG